MNASAAGSRSSPGRVDGRHLAAVFVGGFVGAVARVQLAETWPARAGEWPWATFVANVAGALALGWVATRFPLPSRRHRLLGTGFCGALTTFSTMQLELLQMLDGERYVLAAAYALGSIAAGLAAVALATSVTRRRGWLEPPEGPGPPEPPERPGPPGPPSRPGAPGHRRAEQTGPPGRPEQREHRSGRR